MGMSVLVHGVRFFFFTLGALQYHRLDLHGEPGLLQGGPLVDTSKACGPRASNDLQDTQFRITSLTGAVDFSSASRSKMALTMPCIKVYSCMGVKHPWSSGSGSVGAAWGDKCHEDRGRPGKQDIHFGREKQGLSRVTGVRTT